MTALAMQQKGLKPSTKIVLYWIADHHNGETGECFPSHRRLAELCECSDRDVRRQINKLVEVGLISVENRSRENGSQTSNAYRLHLEGETARTNCPPATDKSSTAPLTDCPAHNLGNNNLGKEPNILVKTDDRFDEFWGCVPKKVGKGQARKAWNAALKKADADAIIQGMRSFAKQREGQDHQFTAHPATWLNGERWLDEATPTASDFYDQIQQHLNGANNELQRAHQIGSNPSDRVPAAIPAPEPFGQRRSPAGNISDSGRGERSHLNLIVPRRF